MAWFWWNLTSSMLHLNLFDSVGWKFKFGVGHTGRLSINDVRVVIHKSKAFDQLLWQRFQLLIAFILMECCRSTTWILSGQPRRSGDYKKRIQSIYKHVLFLSLEIPSDSLYSSYRSNARGRRFDLVSFIWFRVFLPVFFDRQVIFYNRGI